MPADVAGAGKGLEQLKAAVQKGDLSGAQTLLNKLKASRAAGCASLWLCGRRCH